MPRKFFPRRLFALVPVLLFLFPFPVQSQTEEEMAILALYYRPEDLQVISATRSPKPISQVAENISVISGAEMRAMNAHTVWEAIQQIPGVLVRNNKDFGAISLYSIQGSKSEHVKVFVDDIPWNFVSGGAAATLSIPVGAVERIEIIKGPASSAWGSSLGGVIHVITKSAGHTPDPRGTVRGSYGEAASQDYRAEISGKAGGTGYYLFAGHQESNGLEPTRGYENNSLFSKIKLPLGDRAGIGFSFGYTEPRTDQGEYPKGDTVSDIQDRTVWGKLDINGELRNGMEIDFSFYGFRQKYNSDTDTLGMGMLSETPELLLHTREDEKAAGFTGHMAWEKGIQKLVIGAEGNRTDMEIAAVNGPLNQEYGAPPKTAVDESRDLWAVYLNDTITLGDFALTPGIRYDHHEFTGGFLSPSLGLTYLWERKTVFRGTVSRGFNAPNIASTRTGGFFLDPNPDLEHEKIWSFQIGAETTAIPYLWARVSLFHHEIDDIMTRVLYAGDPPANNDLYINQNEDRRRGFEFEMETLPLYKMVIFGGFSYAHSDQDWETDAEEKYKWVAGLRYSDPDIANIRLAGVYTWWDEPSSANASYDDPIWDLNLSRSIEVSKSIRADLFATVHNLFDGSSYHLDYYKNPERWIEAGLRFEF